jgi:PadR family transcriptional regulator, regulatory protein AphA
MTIQSTTEYVVLGALMSGARHGYEIMQFLASALEDTWRLSTSQLYVLLKRLEKGGYLESFAENQESRPPKRIFRLTPEGGRVFLKWLRAPVEHVRDFRMEFLSKMFFFDFLSLPGAQDLLEKQIRVLEERLDKIRKRSVKQRTGFSKLLYGFKARNVESLLSWLAEEARPFVEKGK